MQLYITKVNLGRGVFFDIFHVCVFFQLAGGSHIRKSTSWPLTHPRVQRAIYLKFAAVQQCGSAVHLREG